MGKVNLALLSHDHHSDNLYKKGKAFIKTVPKVLSTKEAVKRLNQTNISSLELAGVI